MRTQTLTLRIRYDETLDDPPESWPFAKMLNLEQDGESVTVLAAGKVEESSD